MIYLYGHHQWRALRRVQRGTDACPVCGRVDEPRVDGSVGGRDLHRESRFLMGRLSAD